MKALLFAAVVGTMMIGCSSSIEMAEPELNVANLVPRVFAPRKAERGFNSIRKNVPTVTKRRECKFGMCNTMDR